MGGQCGFCQKSEKEVHKCSIEKWEKHCNTCCEKISLGLIRGGQASAKSSAFMA